MDVLEGDELQYWLSYTFHNKIMSRVYSLGRAKEVMGNEATKIIEAYRVITEEDGEVRFEEMNKREIEWLKEGEDDG